MSDPPEVVSIPKSTGTHADVLAAVGLADLLSDPTRKSARIVESAGGFEVRPPAPLDDGFFAGLPIGPGYPFLKANENVTVPQSVPSGDIVDYKARRARFVEYRELRRRMQGSPQLRNDPALMQRLQDLQPGDDWRLLQVLNVMQGHKTSNAVHAAIAKELGEGRCDWAREGVLALARGDKRKVPWKVKLVQVFTPNAAKGYARLKPDSTQRGDNTREQWAEPFTEWLKFRGYFRMACPYFVGSKGEHIRLLCPVPADIGVSALSHVAAELRRASLYGSPAKLDSLAVLALARLLIEHSADYHPPEVLPFEGLYLTGKSPGKVVSGVMVTHYQSLGSARAVAAMDTLAVPDWFPITGPDRAQTWLECLDEHRRVIVGLNDSHSDEIGLLIQYRRFLERRGDLALWALLDFMGAYGQFLIRAREQKRRVAAFTTKNFREVVMGLNAEYTRILEDPGFQAMAAAVRRATVSAQAQKAMRQQDYREIRYDLIPELRRKRSLSDSAPFIEVVSDFVSAYNVENARRREMGKRAPSNVTTEQLTAFCSQVEAYGASLMGALLCAYGSCRDPRTEPAVTSEEPEQDAGTGTQNGA